MIKNETETITTLEACELSNPIRGQSLLTPNAEFRLQSRSRDQVY